MSLVVGTAVSTDKIHAPAPLSGQEELKESSISGKSFSEVLDSIRQAIDGSGMGLHGEITAFEQRLSSGSALSSQELLLYQIKAGRFGLGVEMVSKLAEGVMSTVRRFQQGQ